jgi:putative ABC transport system permease protein
VRALQTKLFMDIRDLRAQVVTLAILVVCGVSVLVSSWSSYQALERAQKNYYEKYNFADVFADFQRAPSHILNRISRISGLEYIEGRIVEDALFEIPGQSEPAMGRFVSWEPHKILNKIHLIEGRLPEIKSHIEVLVHKSFAKAHRVHAGDRFQVSFRGQKTQVIVSGIAISPEYVYALSPVSLFPDDKHFGIFWMNKAQLEMLTQMQGSYNNIVGRVSKNVSLGGIKAELDHILKPYGTMGSIDRSKQLSYFFIQDEIRQQKSMAAIIPGIFVLVGSFILNVVVNRLIALQRSQICILKALGYSSVKLVLYYWKLITLILVLGIIPAFVVAEGIGRWYADLYEQYFRFPEIEYSFTRQSSFLGIAAGLIPGWLSSFGALVQVFKLAPAEGMRPPSPPSFHHTHVERWGIWKKLEIVEKMLFRNLIFHPIRTMAAVAGISASIGIMVNGSFWTDIVHFMIDRQFYVAQRNDVEVRFLAARPRDVLNTFKKFSGLGLIEGVRSVGVRIKFKHISKESMLIGLDDTIQMQRIFNYNGKPVLPSDTGLLLSDFFKRAYGIRTGDVVDVEVLSGEFRSFRSSVIGFVEDIIGANAYVSPKFLHRQLNEKNSIDTIVFKIDSTELERIYLKLKKMPVVSVVSVKSLLLKSFQETIADMIQVFTLILIVFAAAISGAVLFNISRISFSEKSWELASLRILGFHERQVFNLLYLELGLQVVVAVIPGLLLGYFLSFLSTHWIHSESMAFPLVIQEKTYAQAFIVAIIIYFASATVIFQKVRGLNLSEALKARE